MQTRGERMKQWATRPLAAAQRAADPGLREDAGARVVQVLDALGDNARCLKARESYLESYPSGIHVRGVARACGVE